MFFVTLLLNAVLAWMRGQSGTNSLRALVYMDEIFGYFPPTAEPPSKKPLLTLLKQARAFGVGVLLATQNPVDLDYKGLSNAGTWLIGRLQTDQDKQRVLDGLEGASGQGGLDRAALEKLISALGSRVFLLNNVHENAPEVFQTRWTMSYLRGPLSRPQIATLMAPLKAALPAPAPPPRRRAAARRARARPRAAAAPAAAAPVAGLARPPRRPRSRAASRRRYLPLRGAAPAGASLAYVPMLIGGARVRLLDTKNQVDETIENTRLAAFADGPIADRLGGCHGRRDRGRGSRVGAARGRGLPRAAGRRRATRRATRAGRRTTPTGSTRRRPSRSSAASRRSSCRAPASPRPTSARGSRRARARAATRRPTTLRAKYETKVAALQQKLHTAQQAVDREENQQRGAGLQTAVSVAGSILGGFLGRKSLDGRLDDGRRARRRPRRCSSTTTSSAPRRTSSASRARWPSSQASFAQDAAGVGVDGAATEQLDSVLIRPKKADIDVTVVTLAFAPHWQDAGGHAHAGVLGLT